MKYRAILLIAIIISIFLPLGIAPLFDLDEGAFSEATREMLESGNYITTYLNGNLRFDKPILIYWLQALSVKIFGLNEFALRLPSAIAGAIWIFATYEFSKRYIGELRAFIASIIMATSLQISIIAKAAIADSLLNLFIATSMFAIWIYLESKKEKFLLIAFATIALGTLTKGPVAIMIPFVVTFIYLAIKREYKLFFKSIFNYKGILIFLIIAAPWYILEYLDQGQKFINGFFLKHNLKRFSSTFESHSGSIFYYIPVLLLGFMPFSGLIFRVFANIKIIFKNDLELFLLIWFAFVFIFFSLSGTKLPHYIIYGYTPLFILIGIYFKDFKFSIILPLILLFILALLPNFINFIPAKNAYIKEILEGAKVVFNLDYQIYLIVAMALLVIAFGIKNIVYRVVFSGIIFISAINFVVIPTYAKVAQEPIKEAALLARAKGINVIMYRFNKPSFLVYLDKKSKKGHPKNGDFVFTKASALNDFKEYKVIYKKFGVYLIKVGK